MKIDLEVESVENGFVISLDGVKYICKTERQLTRRILTAIEMGGREDIKTIAPDMKFDHPIERDIMNCIRTKGYGTAKSITETVYATYDAPREEVEDCIRKSLTALVRRGLLKRGGHKNSKKYYMTSVTRKPYSQQEGYIKKIEQ